MAGLHQLALPSSNASGGDGVNSGGYTFNAPNDDYETNYVARGDWNINDKMKFFARFTIARENAVEAPNEFARRPGNESSLSTVPMLLSSATTGSSAAIR